MILVILPLILQAVCLHRSVENDIPHKQAFSRNATIGQAVGLHSYGMRRLDGASFSTERFIPTECKDPVSASLVIKGGGD
jgi:hypothetical protein